MMARPEIKNITSVGLEYVDENGSIGSLSFSECFENWTSSHSINGVDDYWEYVLDRMWFCVADRYLWGGDYNYVEFYTNPKTSFYFDSSDQAYEELLVPIHKFGGWVTFDCT